VDNQRNLRHHEGHQDQRRRSACFARRCGNFYFENNQVDYAVVNGIDINDGSRVVVRYNTFNNTSVGGHGHDSSPISNRQWEIYSNTFTWDGSAVMDRWIAFRGGTGVVMENITPQLNKFFFMHLCTFALDRLPAGCPKPIKYPWYQQCGWGYDGSHSRDANGQDQQLSPIYSVNNYEQAEHAGASGVIVTCDDAPDCGPGRPSQASFVANNREYYYQTTNFTGATGTGAGTRAARPGTCTTGVAYVSSDFPDTLDKCTATNTWTNAWYRKFTYPHPLATVTDR